MMHVYCGFGRADGDCVLLLISQEFLSCSLNHITAIPDWVCKLEYLEILNVFGNVSAHRYAPCQ